MILRRPVELLGAAIPLLSVAWWSSVSPSWFSGLLLGFLFALYVVAVGQWLTAKRRH